jgi:pimeloyl-ACP methyl ester carboxylesterase
VLRNYGDVNLFGESFGEGTPRVVWLHGWARRGEDFAVSAMALAQKGIASVALDLPGFGASPLPNRAGGARYYAELVLPALRELAIEPLVLVGHSFGGTVATVVASEHPELLRSLVLTGAPLIRTTSRSKSPFAYRATRWLHARHVVSDARLEAARQKYGSTDYQRAQGLLREILVASVNESYEPELSSLTVPVILLWGENDREVPVEIAERAAQLIPVAHSLRVLDGVGHLLPVEASDDLSDVVAGVVAR